MPTIQQLPQAVSVNPTDELMLDQGGTSVSASVAQVLTAAGATITLTGDVTGSGSSTIVTTLAPVATPGTYSKVSVNAKGQVTAGGAMAGADVIGALGFTPYNAANPAGYVAASTLGTMANQNAAAVAITGGSVSGIDLSGSTVLANGSSTARSLAARSAERIDVLDFGADPTGAADSAPAFAAAMASVPTGAWGRIVVPRGSYRLGSFVNQPSGRSIGMFFEDGATITGSGLGVDRIESVQGPYSLWQGGGGWFGFSPNVGNPQNLGFHNDFVQNTPANSAASRIGWSRNYSNYNYYGKYVTGIDIAEQNIFSWPHLYDNSSGWGHWEVIIGTTFDENSAALAHVTASAEHSEFDVVNNGPEAGWTWKSGVGNGVQGMSMDPWGQNGLYGGNILYAYGSVGSFDGQSGGINQRWPSYPAVFSSGNPGAVPTASTIVITFDVTAKATASLSGGGVGSVAVTAGGGAYTSAPSVVFSGGGGSGASASVTMLGGSVVGVTIVSAGSGYSSAPTISFTGGGVATPSATTVTLNGDGAHGDLASAAAAINAASIPLVRAAVAQWGGVVSRLVVFGIAPQDLGTLTLGGTALGPLGINAQAYSTPRDVSAVMIGGTGGCLPTDQIILNGTTITVGGSGAQSDVIAAVTRANLVGIRADSNAAGRLVLTCFLPQNPGGLVIGQPAGQTTLGKLGISGGTYYAPVPPKGFATAMGEMTSPICRTTDRISVAATDLLGNSFGPVTVTLSGGAGSGWPADVATSIQNAVNAAGFASTTLNTLTTSPAVVIAVAKGSGGAQGVLIRNTAGGTLTLANVTGTPLQTMGIAPGTYQPGGGNAGSQSVFMAAEDSIATQGRGVFIGGSSLSTDRTVWPNTPLEARGSFLHGLRTDKAVFDDNLAMLMAPSQAIGFGTGAGSLTLTNNNGTLTANGAPLALNAAVPTAVSQLTNDAGYLVGTVGANLSLTSGTLSAVGAVSSFNSRTGAVSLTGADVVASLGYTPLVAAVGSVAAGAGLAGGTITGTGTISLATIAAGSLMGNAGTLSATPGAVAVGANLSLAAGTLSANGAVSSVNGRAGAVTLGSADVSGALGFTPLATAVTSVVAGGGLAGGTIAGTGTISLGTLAGGSLMGNSGTLAAVPAAVAVGANLALSGGTLSASGAVASFNSRSGAVTLGSADVTGALGYTPPSAAVSNVVAGSGLAGGTITGSGTISLGTLAAGSLMGNSGTLAAVPAAVAVGANLSLAGGTLSASGAVASFNSRSGAVTLSSGDVTGALGYTPVSNAGGTISGTVAFSGTATATTQTGADNSTKLATTGYVYSAAAGSASIATTGGSTTLTAAQYGVPILLVTGTLASAATLVVPNTGVWMVSNRTSGAFALTVKTAAGAGIVVDQGYATELVADGANVVTATTDYNAITLQGSVTNSGTIAGGTLSPATLIAGTAASMVTASVATDAGGYHPVQVKASGTNTNVPLVFAPAGSGYLAAALSDGTAANGNQRGQYAVDWQQSRTANTQVASGAYAAVPGGAGNTAGGNYSLAAGQNSTATGQGSVALGQYANDGGAYGKLVFSANANAVGNQFGLSTLYVSSASAATRMTSDGAAAGAANSVPIRSNHVIAGTLTVSARNVSNGDGAYWSIPVLFKNSAGTVSVTSPGASGIAPTVADSTLSTASIAIAADNSNKGLSVTITPPAATTVNASAVFLAAEM